jgi:hypothetical protein
MIFRRFLRIYCMLKKDVFGDKDWFETRFLELRETADIICCIGRYANIGNRYRSRAGENISYERVSISTTCCSAAATLTAFTRSSTNRICTVGFLMAIMAHCCFRYDVSDLTERLGLNIHDR